MYAHKKIPTRIPNKGKGLLDDDLEREHRWVLEKIGPQIAKNSRTTDTGPSGEDNVIDGIDCGCCFSEYVAVSRNFSS